MKNYTLPMTLAAAMVAALAWLVVLAEKAGRAEAKRCEEAGGSIISKSSSGFGNGLSSNGSPVLVMTTNTVSFCVTPDGRVLW